MRRAFVCVLVACGSTPNNTPDGSTPLDGSTPADSSTPNDGAAATDASNPDGAIACSNAVIGANTSFNGYRMFPADNPINTAIDTLPVNGSSANWLANCSTVGHLQLFPGMPYNIVPANTPPVTATSLTYNTKPYPNPWPFPARR